VLGGAHGTVVDDESDDDERQSNNHRMHATEISKNDVLVHQPGTTMIPGHADVVLLASAHFSILLCWRDKAKTYPSTKNEGLFALERIHTCGRCTPPVESEARRGQGRIKGLGCAIETAVDVDNVDDETRSDGHRAYDRSCCTLLL